MRKANEEEVTNFKARPKNPGPKKSLFRKAFDLMKPGDAIILDKGTDYQDYRNVYYTMKEVESKSGFKFTLEESEDKNQALVKCV